LKINDAFVFLLFNLNGIIIGFLFDIFRVLRKTFRTINFVTYIEDILFWILTGISIIFFMYKFTDGNIRIFMILGLIFGTIIYIIIFSKLIINSSIVLINTIKSVIKIIASPIKVFFKLVLKVLNKLKCKITIKKDNIRFKKTKINKKN